MLKMAGEQAVVLPTLTLALPGNFEVQLAAHLTLQQLQNFAQDVDQCLKSLVQSGWPMIDRIELLWTRALTALQPAICYNIFLITF